MTRKRDDRAKGEAVCTDCGKRLKWREEARGSFGMLRRWYHARIADSFVAASGMTVEIASHQFHAMYGGRL